MDGVDLACCDFFRDDAGWNFKIVAADTLPYPVKLKRDLENACNWTRTKIKALDLELGEHFAKLLNTFHDSHCLIPDLVASHGHTILHEPDKGTTLQAGDGEIMMKSTGITVVNNFRTADVAQGGQGAPLVPIGDLLLFGRYDACLNLGGFANISYTNLQGQRIAYDLCPANMALNWISSLDGKEFDEDGAIAKLGRVDLKLEQN